MPRIFLGVVADDFTGAADAASFLVASGIPTLLFNGIPKENRVFEVAVPPILNHILCVLCSIVQNKRHGFELLKCDRYT